MYFLPRSLVALFALSLLVGCPTSDNLTSSTGSGGNGTGGEGAGEAGSMTQSSSTGIGPCDEDPCKLLEPQCGCEEDLACTVDAAGARLCAQKGPGGPGTPCSDTALCDAGLICAGYPGLLSCHKFCDANNQCEMPGGKCELTLTGVSGVKMCTEDCNLISNSGCALLGSSCQYALTTDEQKPYTLCAPSGDGLNQAPCIDTGDCAPGSVCLPNTVGEVLCFQWCDVGAPACPADFACTPYEIAEGVPLTIGDINYGVCNPN